MKKFILIYLFIFIIAPLQAQEAEETWLSLLEHYVLRNGKKVYCDYDKYASDSDNSSGLKLEDGTILIPYKYSLIYYVYVDENDEGVILAQKKYGDGWYPEVYSLDSDIIIPCKAGRSVKRHRDPYDKTIYFSVTDTKEKMCHIIDEKGITIFSLSYNNNSKYDIDDIERCHDEYDGILYYRAKDSDKQGIIDKDGKWVISCIFKNIEILRLPNGAKYYKTQEESYWQITEIFDSSGKNPVPQMRRVADILKDSQNNYYFLAENNNFRYSLYDLNGKEITPNGNYQDIKIADNGLIKVKEDNCWGILTVQGQEILPAEYEEVEYIGNDFIKFKLNGFYGIMTIQGKVIIPTSRGYTSIGKYIKSQKIFPYTMDGYKGECNNLGVQISKIKVSTPQNNASTSSSATSSSNDSNASSSSSSNGYNTTTVVVKHERDPQPMQVWIPCGGCGQLSPGQCNLCNGTGKNLYGSGFCRSCHGSGRCTYCNGKGGHYEVRYQ